MLVPDWECVKAPQAEAVSTLVESTTVLRWGWRELVSAHPMCSLKRTGSTFY